jgi:MYXO-CTERM domain-containing protein
VSDTSPGAHRLRIDASIRGTSTVISSEEITFELTCNGGAFGCAVSPPRRTSARAPLGLALVLVLVVARRRR